MITAALTGKLEHVSYINLPIFNLSVPSQCENVPTEILNPRDTWSDKKSYDDTAKNLASKFIKNFEKFANETDASIVNAGPIL
jgi:phosphoenolpyruvate carboxykinase (ATP)